MNSKQDFSIDEQTIYPFGKRKKSTVFLANIPRPAGVFVGGYAMAHGPPDATNFFTNQLLYYANDNLIIGRFTHFAREAKIFAAGANHMTDAVSAYNFSGVWRAYDEISRDRWYNYKGPTIIGNDVWVGYGAIILSGVHIGDGAIIGAGSVVTRDVPPYAFVAGAPAVIKRIRYPEKVVAGLLASRWWEWPKSVIKEAIPLLVGNDVAAHEELERIARTVVAYPQSTLAIAVIVYAPDAGKNLERCITMLFGQLQQPAEVIVVSGKECSSVLQKYGINWVQTLSHSWRHAGLEAAVSKASLICFCTENDLLDRGYLVTVGRYMEMGSYAAAVGQPEKEQRSFLKRVAYKFFGTIDVRAAGSFSWSGIYREAPLSDDIQMVKCVRGPALFKRTLLDDVLRHDNEMLLSAALTARGLVCAQVPQARWWPLYSRQERLYGRTINAAMVASYKDAMQQHVLPRNSLAYFGYYWTLFGFWLRKKMGH